MPKKAKSYPMYYLEWYDHWGANHGGWSQPGEFESKPIQAVNVGWQVAEDKYGILLAGSICQNGALSQITYVLKSAITKKKKLSPAVGIPD